MVSLLIGNADEIDIEFITFYKIDKNTSDWLELLTSIIGEAHLPPILDLKLIWKLFELNIKAPITTAADDKFCNIFPSFRQK